ncbi:MBL fold metallo-hydrolase [Nodosilinea sp. P-1105]|uniref:MBL fold metallo-hydrolase n=1 Tax=Nodosilinea sp. P-1105 TaxID=2546229 RepID=UPI00146D2162|nr:MBL fold metallo-hydrolase [Nodosilinea sp. P-1105]NMF85978.1 MBL fold metallo-hydrolase [Nodosilinea sp. P-1105]
MQVTWFDSNSWLWEMAGKRILVDPWLVDDLVFGHQPWLFKGEHPQPHPLPEHLDLILLSQGLEDHAHPPTLSVLDRQIPVAGSPNAAKVARELGYEQVTTLHHGEVFTLDRVLTIKAVPGAPLGPTLTENGYVVRDLVSQVALFYEPHGYHRSDLADEGPIDVVITPMADLALPLVGAIIRGRKGAPERVDWLDPQVVLPTANAGEVMYSGVLNTLLKTDGGPAALAQRLQAQGRSTQVITPIVGQPVPLDLSAKRSVAAQ